MIITPDYCLTMARYNAWQNKQLIGLFPPLGETELKKDRKAFFGSILATASHLLWGDRLWFSRFGGCAPPEVPGTESTTLVTSGAEWAVERFRTDGAMLRWAEDLRAIELEGEMEWYSGAAGGRMSRPRAFCVMQMLNHQTHHRGQIHAMLTAAGSDAPVTDLQLMPPDGPWL